MSNPSPHSPGVSVVTPFLNAERFLGEAIASVFAQTYRDWELLLVDDGSSDRSTAIARDAALREPDRVRYLAHPGHRNRGASASRNLGILDARAEYIALLDSDDAWVPAKLAEQVAILDARPDVDLVYGPTLYWYSWTDASATAEPDHVPEIGMPLDVVIPPPALVIRVLRREAHLPSMSNVILRRAAALRAGLFEEQFHGMHDDHVFLAKLCLRSRVFASRRCWDRYRQHPASCVAVATASGARRRSRHRYLRWLARYLEQQGERGGPVWATVQEQLRPYRFTARVRGRAKGIARSARTTAAGWLRGLVPSGLRHPPPGAPAAARPASGKGRRP